MVFRVSLVSVAVCLAGAVTSQAQQPSPSPGSVPLVQPGAPGESSRNISPAAAVAHRGPAEADTSFMQGMIMHHSQAVEMTDLMKARTHNKALLSLGKRISISQTDEMKFMKQWLKSAARQTSMGHEHMHHGDGSMGLMPGMLSSAQMKALAKANGKTFDHLFLTGMIQHHNGALIMVDELFDTPGAGQGQCPVRLRDRHRQHPAAEIEIMRGMLKEKK